MPVGGRGGLHKGQPSNKSQGGPGPGVHIKTRPTQEYPQGANVWSPSKQQSHDGVSLDDMIKCKNPRHLTAMLHDYLDKKTYEEADKVFAALTQGASVRLNEFHVRAILGASKRPPSEVVQLLQAAHTYGIKITDSILRMACRGKAERVEAVVQAMPSFGTCIVDVPNTVIQIALSKYAVAHTCAEYYASELHRGKLYNEVLKALLRSNLYNEVTLIHEAAVGCGQSNRFTYNMAITAMRRSQNGPKALDLLNDMRTAMTPNAAAVGATLHALAQCNMHIEAVSVLDSFPDGFKIQPGTVRLLVTMLEEHPGNELVIERLLSQHHHEQVNEWLVKRSGPDIGLSEDEALIAASQPFPSLENALDKASIIDMVENRPRKFDASTAIVMNKLWVTGDRASVRAQLQNYVSHSEHSYISITPCQVTLDVTDAFGCLLVPLIDCWISESKAKFMHGIKPFAMQLVGFSEHTDAAKRAIQTFLRESKCPADAGRNIPMYIPPDHARAWLDKLCKA